MQGIVANKLKQFALKYGAKTTTRATHPGGGALLGTGFAIMRSGSSAGSDLARAGVFGTEGLDRHAQIVDARAVGPAVDAGRQAVDRACEQTAGQPAPRAAVGRGAQADSAIGGGAAARSSRVPVIPPHISPLEPTGRLTSSPQSSGRTSS